MGYFSNGSEGADYQARYCGRCLHDNPDKDILCPVWALQLAHNYGECNKPDSFLDALIPRASGGLGNDCCRMFVERSTISNLAIEQFESHVLGHHRAEQKPLDR